MKPYLNSNAQPVSTASGRVTELSEGVKTLGTTADEIEKLMDVLVDRLAILIRPEPPTVSAIDGEAVKGPETQLGRELLSLCERYGTFSRNLSRLLNRLEV